MKQFEICLAYSDTPTHVTVRQRSYGNGRPALELLEETEEGIFPYAIASVNLPDVLLEDNEILIKDYSENEGMLNFLTHNNIVHVTGKGVNSGFVWIPVCKLLPESEWGKSPVTILPQFEINGYTINAESYEEAMEIMALIQNDEQ